ncbi:hypothetical protein VK792_14450 [Mesobacterium sp. TK19101]|uniref:Uncharacterized protein n=1 Tax=Mesobacterium hydrothermale TaxID=3111907 RepID=A0ABU6HMS0_9RHOB|nr:hypothetical protein [Mesobacterium sp. TK19101]MEC3862490.1 hypothetical protein [Mesobacterium sp. TK19101]
MTALQEYERLEAVGLWRPSPDAQRREVIVSIGDATVMIADGNGQMLTHWSLAAVTRANKGKRPAIYHPDTDTGETLELAEDEADMIDALEKVLAAIERRRPHPGRLRVVASISLATTVAFLALFWLPGALMRHTVRVLPDVKRSEIGQALLADLVHTSGQPCRSAASLKALDALSQRLLGAPGRIVVLPGGVEQTAHLPGGLIVLNRALIEDWEAPEIPAGFVIAEALRADRNDPVADLLDDAGLWASLRLLTTGSLPPEALRRHAENLLTAAPVPVPQDALIDAFAAAQVPTTGYAYAVDVTGETTLPLIEADPMAGKSAPPVLTDSNWVRLQGLCEN